MADSQGAAPEQPRAKHGVLTLVIALAIVAAVVIAGVVPRRRASAALEKETNDLAVPTVAVIHPKLGAP